MKAAIIQLKEAIHYYNLSCGGEEYKIKLSECEEALFCDVMKQYSTQVARQALGDAASNAEVEDNGNFKHGGYLTNWEVNKQSILDTEIKTP